MLRLLLLLLLLSVACDAQAYIGPGAGIGFLGSLWAWLVGFLVVIAAILFWPIRWFLRRLRSGRSAAKSDAPASAE